MKTTCVAAALVLLATAGCGNDTVPGTGVKVEQKGGEVVLTGKTREGDAKVTVGAHGEIALPPAFPKDVPVPPGASVKTALTLDEELMVTLTAKGKVAEVLAYYQEQMKGQGWTLDAPLVLGPSTALSGRKGKRECAVSFTQTGADTALQIHLSGGGK